MYFLLANKIVNRYTMLLSGVPGGTDLLTYYLAERKDSLAGTI